jgi:hypothetical protein
MKNKTLLATFLAILLSVIGCDRKESPVKVGPFNVNGSTGIATGQAFGVAFNVEGASGAEVTSTISASPQSSSQAEMTLADDLKIKLQTLDEGNAVSFELNGKTFGKLQRGDKVEIDKSRNVRINGAKRTSEDSPPN